MSSQLLSSSDHTFEQGDLALLVFIKKHRRFIVPVVISMVTRFYNYDTETSAAPTCTVIGYLVSSGYGGELRVAPDMLLPDTALDRIVAALSSAEELRRSSS